MIIIDIVSLEVNWLQILNVRFDSQSLVFLLFCIFNVIIKTQFLFQARVFGFISLHINVSDLQNISTRFAD